MKRFYFLFLFLLSFSLFSEDKFPIPVLKKFVVDSTNTLQSIEVDQLEAKLSTLAKVHGSQVVLVIVPNTGDLSIEEFALKIGEQNKIGSEKKDDGVVFLIAKDIRKMRIEVGYGLEGVLTDADCKRIIANTVSPKFSSGHFFDGVNSGIDEIILKINGNPITPDLSKDHNSNSSEADELDEYLPAFIVLLIGYFLHFIFGFIISACFSGLLAFLIGPLLMGFGIAKTIILAVALFFISFLFNLFTNAFIGGNSSSSSGGFSGGGGSFGGGGSSGSW